MSLATVTPFARAQRPAAIFACTVCEGWHLANGYRASPYQVHSPVDSVRIGREGDWVVCDGCGCARPLVREGESIPVSVGRWPELPKGL